MKKIFLPLGLCAVLGLGSCSEDFEVAAPYKNYTVVYGILDRADTAHYIRIQKAFLDENKSAINMAKEADSSYYPSLNVSIQAYENGNPVGSSIPLNKVDLDIEKYPKNAPANEQGFFTKPSYAYKFKADLNPFYTYKLTITNPETGLTHTADIPIVSNDPNQSNVGFYVQSFNKDTVQLSFERTLPNSKLTAGGSTLGGNIPRNGAIFEGLLRFHYIEKNSTSENRKFVDYRIKTFENKTSSFALPIANTSLYGFLRDEIGIAPAGVTRYMGFVEIHLYAGNQDLATYNQLTNNQGGLTGDQIKPIYTNIKGTDAIGIAASKAHRVHYQGYITSGTLDSLKINPLTRDLRIEGRAN